MIRIADVTTQRTAHIKLEQEGLETVDRVMVQASAAFDAKRIAKLLVGDLDVHWRDWLRTSASDLLLTGEPWIVKSVEKRDCPDIEVKVIYLGAETRQLILSPDDTLDDLFERACIDFSDINDLRLICNGRQLSMDSESLRDRSIEDGATIQAVLRVCGGGVGLPPGLSFVDIDADAAPKAISWAKRGPWWRVAKPGLCIEGVCKKRGCRAFRKTVVMNFGFTYLNLVSRSHECLCPECRGHVEPDTCAFNNCYWKIFGQKRESPEQSPTAVVIPERHADDAYHRFESETSGKAQWLSLVLIAYKSNAEYCWDCCKPVLSGDETRRFPCCHVAHLHCTTRSSSCRRCSTGTSPFHKSHSIN